MVIPCLCSFQFTALRRPFSELVGARSLAETVLLPSRPPANKKPQSKRLEVGGGELGTRTPDPLRVMHDDFLIFIALIRQIDEICYRSATNATFEAVIISPASQYIFSNNVSQ